MRKLRSTALSRPPPRTLTTERPAAQKDRTAHTIGDLQTLHEVKEFLESRRKAAARSSSTHEDSRGAKEDEHFAVETKRIATIFSS